MELTLQQLKEIAIKLNFAHSPNIGLETLKNKLIVHAEELGTTLDEVAESMFSDNETLAIISEESEPIPIIISAKKDVKMEATIEEKIESTEKTPSAEELEIERLSKLSFADIDNSKAKKNEAVSNNEALKLIRVIVTCNNPNKSGWHGEVIYVRNAVLPPIQKFVAFNVVYHVPQIILNVLKERKYNVFSDKKLPTGITTRVPRQMAEYNIEILPPITKDELDAIKSKQLAEGYGNE